MILPQRKDLDKAKAFERKREIDNGIGLARQVDELRTTFAQEKLIHQNWLKSSREELLNTIKGLDDGIQQKKLELARIEEERRELLIPLDSKWSEVKKEKEIVKIQRNEFFLDKERFAKSESDLKNEQKRVSLLFEENTKAKRKIEGEKIESENLKKETLEEYRIAKEERNIQTTNYSKKLAEIDQREQEYEVALQTIKLKEKQVEEKELEIIEREKDVERRIKNLQRITN